MTDASAVKTEPQEAPAVPQVSVEEPAPAQPQQPPSLLAGLIPDTAAFTKEIEERAQRERDALSKLDAAQIHALPVRSYLDQTVIPVLIEALKALVKERPPNPCEYVAMYLLRNNAIDELLGKAAPPAAEPAAVPSVTEAAPLAAPEASN